MLSRSDLRSDVRTDLRSELRTELNPKELAQRAESLIRQSSNRYLTTVRIAYRAKQRRFDDFDGLLEDSSIKPVQRAVIELSDEQDQPDLLPG
jgi:DNA-directed RNA polymerase subunit omega